MVQEDSDQLPALMKEARETRDSEARRARPLEPGETLDPNRSPAEELDRLPGVGAATAEAIVQTRVTQGGFHQPEDLLDVPGIGPARLAKIRDHLDFSRGVPLELRRQASREASVDPNRATDQELQALPGIGPSLARRILDFRRDQGPFRTPDDLLKVRGIGPKILERLRPLIRIGP